jgi:RNA polymerase sigma-70 factor (ECF subfamily)
MFGFSFDTAYVRQLTDGDADTEQHFHTYFGRLLLIKLRQRLRSPAEVLDARQETLMRVLVSLRQKRNLEHPERLGAFVNAVCNNVLLEMGRASRRTVPLSDVADPDVPATVTEETPETTLVTAEQQARVRDTLAQLPERDRRLLRQVFLEEEDKDVVCREFGVDRQYLRVLLHRAKARFRQAYQQDPVTGRMQRSEGTSHY